MEAIKKQIEVMEKDGYKFNTPWLQLGIKQEGGGVKSTGRHVVSVVEEPKLAKGTDVMTGKETDVFSMVLDEEGQEKKYDIPLFNKNGDPHYLLKVMADIPVGEKFSMEMKAKGIKNYIEVIYPLGEKEVEIPTIEEDESLEGLPS